MRRGALALAAALACLTLAGAAVAQLSPGPLAAAHAGLEGSDHCFDCHRAGKGVEPELCLDCHTALGARIEAAQGLHARPGHEDCKRCHIEHNGRDFELVWWGDAGIRAFDHEQAGHTLSGAHAVLECRQCHRPERLHDPSALRAGGAGLDTTFLGLEAGCASCHADVHGGALGEACASCHGEEHFSPATGFDHDRTAWPLRGRHRTQRCEACHASRRSDAQRSGASLPKKDGAAATPLFADDVRGTTCAACHQDPHRGRLGSGCADCHRETSWTTIDEGSFDHGKTRFPLLGLHAAADCAGCHRSGAAAERDEFERCDSCHGDPHLGQFAARSDQGDCRSRHDEQGFAPARFSIADHARTAYPLDGAHLAVPCDGCHVVADEASAPSSAPAAAAATTDPRPPIVGHARRYRFPSTACVSCHRTPHDEGAAASAGCDRCHTTSAWTPVRFDHATTRFPLEAAHARLECTTCHRPDRAPDASLPPGGLPLGGLPLTCAGCHRDVHDGQLDRDGALASCDRCHTADHWAPAALFDHDRDSRFALVGAHRAASCAGCHAVETRGGVALTRYRPLATGCADCHGSSSTPARP